MKWTNKGHEYDNVYMNIKDKKSFYLFGAGNDGKMACDILTSKFPSIKINGFIDNDISKHGTIYMNLPVYSLDHIKKNNDVGIIVSFASEVIRPIDEQLKNVGYVKNLDFFHYEEFLSVLFAYEYNKLFISSISFLPTTRCNLRCKSCLNFTPYLKNFENKDLNVIKKDVDLFFEKVSYVGVFFITGGEPMLYKNISDVIRYIDKHYIDKIYSFEIVTNGTVELSEDILKAVADCNIKVTVDDYTNALPQYIDKFNNVVDNLVKYAGREKVKTRIYDEWIDLYPHEQKEYTEYELVEKYNCCHVPWQEYNNGKLYTCNYASFAAKADITSIDESEIYDISKVKNENIKEVMEFRLGFSEKGYAEFCKKCAGYIEINPYKVKPAIQI